MPNSIIVLLFIQKIFKILAYTLEDFLLRFGLFLGTVSRYKHFFLQILLKKYITSIEQYVLCTLAFLSFRLFFRNLWFELELFRLWIAVNVISLVHS